MVARAFWVVIRALLGVCLHICMCVVNRSSFLKRDFSLICISHRVNMSIMNIRLSFYCQVSYLYYEISALNDLKGLMYICVWLSANMHGLGCVAMVTPSARLSLGDPVKACVCDCR